MTVAPPRSIPRAAFFLWLDRRDPPVSKADLHTLIDLAGLPERARRDAHILVDEAAEFDRTDPLLLAIAPALGVADQAAIDRAIIEALALRV
jgi:hypothetical protein